MQNLAVKNVVFFAAGLVTTAVALALVYLATTEFEFNVMGFYLVFVVPIGAIIVGMIAAAGYGVSARALGVKVTAKHLVAVVALQVAAYFAAQYVEFYAIASQLQAQLPEGLSLGDIHAAGLPEEAVEGVRALQAGFWGYFDYQSRAFGFEDFGSEGMGGFGYIFRLLDIAGFVGGAWLTLNIAGSKPFCDDCQTYYQEHVLGFAPFHEDDDQRHRQRIEEAVAASSIEDLTAALADPAIQAKDDAALGSRVRICHWGCPQCHQGWFGVDLMTTNGNDTTTAPIAEIAGTPHFHAQFKALGHA